MISAIIQFIQNILFSPEAFTTLVVGVVGFWWHSRTSRNFMRRQHTFNIVSQSVMDEVLQNRVSALQKYNSKYTGDDKANPEDWKITSQDDDLRGFLNFLEGISAAVRNGDLDEDLLHSTYRGVIVGYFKKFEKHIYAHRESSDTQKAFEHLEWLYNKWK